MILSDISVRRPVFAAVMSLVLILVGVISYTRLPVRDLPDIETPIVSVETSYRGANAQVVENRVTQVIEDRISGIEGVEAIISTSRDGRSDITIEFSAARDIDAAANDVRDRVSRIVDDLPEEADPPEISKIDVDARPILWFNLSHPDWSAMELSDYANRFLADRFSAVDGVSRVNISGDATPGMRVWLSRQKLAAFGLTAEDISAALQRQNVELPAGRIEGESTNLTVRVNRQFNSVEQFRQLVVGRAPDGYLIRLGDVARVSLEPEFPYSFYNSNGSQAIGLGIVRQSGANTLQVANNAKALLAEIQPMLPEGMQIGVSSDSSLFIDRAIRNVWITLFEAAVLVIAVIFVFLGSARATIIPALTVPICLIATFAVLFIAGYSLNLLTLLAFVLAIGVVVDDAIVVLENIYYRIEEGEPPLVAAFRGARQVGFAVIATTLVICAVFVPLYFVAGNTGLLFRELAGAMIGALAFSGFVALTLIPMLCSKMLKPRGTDEGNAFSRWFDRNFLRVRNRYRRALTRIIHRPLLVGGTALFVVGICAALGATLPGELAPEEDVGQFNVNILAAEGTGYERMKSYMVGLEQKILPMVDEGIIRRVNVRAPAGFSRGEDFNSGNMIVFLEPWEQRSVSTRDVVNRFQAIISADPHIRGNASIPNDLARGRGRPIQFVIAGSTFEELVVARNAIFAAAANHPGLIDLDSNYRETKPQLLIDIDTARAGDLGVSISEIGRTLETMMGSRRVTTFIDRGEEYYVVLQAEDADRATRDDLANIYVRSQTGGGLVPITSLVSMQEVAQAGELGRFNRLRAITIEGNIAPGTTLGQALDFLDAVAMEQPQVAAIGYRGESLALRETGSSLWVVLGLTIILVFLVLAAQFESFVHPIVIILTVPLAVGGGLFGLWVMGGTINLYSQVGIVMLVGLAAKNGILIVEFANQLRDEGVEFTESIIGASERRLRPVLMTSIATIAGAIPLMLAAGAGAGARQAVGVVVVWGVSLATLLTLFVVPVFYNALARRTRSPETISRELEAGLKVTPDAAPDPAE